MTPFLIMTFFLILLAATLFFLSDTHAADIKVMTFNIRRESSEDVDEHNWKNRKNLVTETLEEAQIIGLQEVASSQLKDISDSLKDYKYVGIGRADGKSKGDYNPIFYNSKLFKLKEHGTFWLSETPTQIGSKSWDSHEPSICTWARFINTDNAGIYVFNTHLDEKSKRSRELSTTLILEQIKERKHIDEPVILLGSLHTEHGSKPLHTIQTVKDYRKKSLVDSFLRSRPRDTNPATKNYWNHKHKGSGKTDYIFHSSQLRTVKSSILKPTKRKATASDHWPQLSYIRWNSKEQNQEIAWQYLKEVLLDKEYGAGVGHIIRWDIQEIPIRIIGGNKKQQDLTLDAIKEMNEVLVGTGTQLKVVHEPYDKEIRCYIGNSYNLESIIEKEELDPPEDYNGFASVQWFIHTKIIVEATVLIAPNKAREEDLYHIILEELTHTLGLTADQASDSAGITYSRGNDHGSAKTYSTQDKKAIKLLYKHLRAGDKAYHVKSKFNQYWNSL